ncbi:metalloregulator ArsR/SmtB family transcription factor [Candidatus Rhodoblastus alkanivorans]|uniref:ArsR/SmtB family transcription factor n=1 Tax=Candidatus Rhodoblastus alkanivorans TaxID=2954117 RepID=UPI0030145D99
MFAQFAAVAKAMAHEHRLELLELVAQGERSVENLAERSGITIANASQHLQHLRRAGLVAARRQGKFALYRLADDSVLAMLAAMRKVAERNIGEVDRILRAYSDASDNLSPMSRAELMGKLEKGAVTVLDVRPEDEYAAGHLPGARNLPLDQISREAPKLGRDDEIVAYCRGPYCILSFEAVAELRKAGFNARRMEDGFPEWKAAGLPVEKGAGSRAS